MQKFQKYAKHTICIECSLEIISQSLSFIVDFIDGGILVTIVTILTKMF